MPAPSGVAPPNLPIAPREYSSFYQDQFSNALRLFFQNVSSEINAPAPHASYFDSTTQTNPTASAVNLFKFDGKISEFKISRGDPPTKIFVNESGVYNFQFSAQLDKTSGGKGTIFIWPRVNGQNIPNSATKMVIQGNNDQDVAAWNFILVMNAGDFFELAWQSSDTSVVILAENAASNYPAIPSIIMTVNWISNFDLTGNSVG